MRPKSIVYFERIIFGVLLLDILQTYLGWDQIIAQVAMSHPNSSAVARALTVTVFFLVLVATLTLLVSRRRSKIAMWILIAWVVLGLSLFLVRLVQSTGGLLGLNIVRVIGAGLYFIGEGAAVGLLFTPSARRWMRREDEKNEKLREVFH